MRTSKLRTFRKYRIPIQILLDLISQVRNVGFPEWLHENIFTVFYLIKK
jgi:hypothetical protein